MPPLYYIFLFDVAVYVLCYVCLCFVGGGGGTKGGRTRDLAVGKQLKQH